MVEGDTEYLAFPLLARGLVPQCPPLKATNIGGIGSHMAPIGIARLVVHSVIRHQVAGRGRVVICIDREQRQECAPSFASDVMQALSGELQARGRPAAGVTVVVADRAFEAWLLADAAGLHAKRAFVRAPNFGCFEGALGQGRRKGCAELDHLLGHPYAKTTDGPNLFRRMDLAVARAASRSLDKFLRSVGV